jgi:hypothetical protein
MFQNHANHQNATYPAVMQQMFAYGRSAPLVGVCCIFILQGLAGLVA